MVSPLPREVEVRTTAAAMDAADAFAGQVLPYARQLRSVALRLVDSIEDVAREGVASARAVAASAEDVAPARLTTLTTGNWRNRCGSFQSC